MATFARIPTFEQRGRSAHVAAADRTDERGGALADRELPGFHEVLPARPAPEAILASDDELGVVKRDVHDPRGRAPETRMIRAQPRDRVGLGPPRGGQQRAGPLAVEVQRGAGGNGSGGHRKDLLHAMPVVRNLGR